MESKTQKKEEKTPISDLAYMSKYGSTSDFKLDESGGVSGVERFEDLLEIIGTFGRWNITIFFICSLVGFANALQVLTYEFLGATPDYWCHVGPLVDANWTKQQIFDLAIPSNNDSKWDGCTMYSYNYSMAAEIGYESATDDPSQITIGNNSSKVHCHSRDFDTSVYKSTVVTDWDLVCERRTLYSTTQAATQAGGLVGFLIFGYFLDKFGRRPVILVCVVLLALSGLAASLAPGLTCYVIMRALISCFLTGIYTGCFVVVMELCTSSQRSSVGTMFVMPWALGYMAVPGLAYLIKPWRWLQAANTIPTFFLFSYFWLLPESPRWLIFQGHSERVVEVLKSAAKVNRRTLPPSEALIVSLNAMTPTKKEENNGTVGSNIISNIKYVLSLVIHSDLRIKTLICFFCWFAVSMVYYGVSLNSENMSVDPYIYVFLGGVTEVIAYLLLWLMLTYLGRKVSLISLYVLCTITISIIALLMGILEEVSSGLMMFLSLSGKLGITAAFHLIYIYTAELFPTKYRSLALGESGVMGRVGSILSPYINDILGAAISWGPSALFASVSVVAACLSLILPETKGTDLTEEDSQEKKENSQKIENIKTQINVNEAFEPDF